MRYTLFLIIEVKEYSMEMKVLAVYSFPLIVSFHLKITIYQVKNIDYIINIRF
jgi:hypothetical protein